MNALTQTSNPPQKLRSYEEIEWHNLAQFRATQFEIGMVYPIEYLATDTGNHIRILWYRAKSWEPGPTEAELEESDICWDLDSLMVSLEKYARPYGANTIFIKKTPEWFIIYKRKRVSTVEIGNKAKVAQLVN